MLICAYCGCGLANEYSICENCAEIVEILQRMEVNYKLVEKMLCGAAQKRVFARQRKKISKLIRVYAHLE